MKQAPLTLRRWRRVEYERLVDLGAFEDGEPVELIGGQLIVAEPKGSEHATGVEMAGDALRSRPAGPSAGKIPWPWTTSRRRSRTSRSSEGPAPSIATRIRRGRR